MKSKILAFSVVFLVLSTLVGCSSNNKDDNFVYDKLGNEYASNELYKFKYSDKEGNIYSLYKDDSEDSFAEDNWYISDTTKEEIYWEFAVIDKDGYISQIDPSNSYCYLLDYDNNEVDAVYGDKNGNLYYNPKFCIWDKNGKLELTYDKLYSITYDEVVKNGEPPAVYYEPAE